MNHLRFIKYGEGLTLTHLHAVLAEQVQHVLINIVHLLGLYSLHLWVEALQVSKEEPESVSQLENNLKTQKKR